MQEPQFTCHVRWSNFGRCPATFSAARSKGDVQLFDACTPYFGHLYISEDWGLPETQHELQGIQLLCGCPCGRIESGSIYRLDCIQWLACQFISAKKIENEFWMQEACGHLEFMNILVMSGRSPKTPPCTVMLGAKRRKNGSV